MFKRKPNQSNTTPTRTTDRTTRNPTGFSHPHDHFILERQSDVEEDPPSDLSDSTIPVDQWSIESVPKPGFTPVEHLQVLKFVSRTFLFLVVRLDFCFSFSLKTSRTQHENSPIRSTVLIVLW